MMPWRDPQRNAAAMPTSHYQRNAATVNAGVMPSASASVIARRVARDAVGIAVMLTASRVIPTYP